MRRDDLIAVADSIHAHVKAIMPPVHERIESLERSWESRIAVLTRDMELTITRELGTVRERVAALESRPPVPGPPGPPGSDGKDGKDGEPGSPGLQYLGVYQTDKEYSTGHIVTYSGSAWHCNAMGTMCRPGDGSAAWTLMVKRGQDAKGSH